jgi:hypothetical protein
MVSSLFLFSPFFLDFSYSDRRRKQPTHTAFALTVAGGAYVPEGQSFSNEMLVEKRVFLVRGASSSSSPPLSTMLTSSEMGEQAFKRPRRASTTASRLCRVCCCTNSSVFSTAKNSVRPLPPAPPHSPALTLLLSFSTRRTPPLAIFPLRPNLHAPFPRPPRQDQSDAAAARPAVPFTDAACDGAGVGVWGCCGGS